MRIPKRAERRSVLGLQGFWPGRRWCGRDGIRAALAGSRRFHVDPLNVVGHNEELVFASRKEAYQPADLYGSLYTERAGYEFGGAVSIFPKETFPLPSSWAANQQRT